jgi:large subunit ribosomal protein L23
MSVLIKPLITEKLSAMNEKGRYGFLVDLKANKIEIKKAVEKMYGVKVAEVNTMRTAGKPKSKSTQTKIVTGRTSATKKAIVTVAEGEMIDFYSGI